MRKRSSSFLKWGLILFVILVLITSITVFFIEGTRADINKQNQQYLEEIAVQCASTIKNTVDLEIDKVEAITSIISAREPFSLDYTMDILKVEDKRSNFKRLGFVTLDGEVVATDDKNFNISDRSYFLDAVSGKSTVSDRMTDKVNGEFINVYSTPIYQNEELLGVIIATSDAENFSELLGVSTFYGEGYSYVIDKKGELIAYANREIPLLTENLFDELLIEGAAEKEVDYLMQSIQNNESDFIEYVVNDERHVAAFTAVGVNDWYVFTVVPKSVISQNADNIILRNFTIVALAIIIIGGLAIFVVIQNYKNNLKLKKVAFYDPLTGCYNLAYFKQLASEVLKKNRSDLYMVRIDIDNFKMINEMYGFEEGDFILKKMEKLITEILSGDDLHCQLGGDDFLALLRYSSDADVIEKGTVFRKEFSQFLEVNEKRYTLNFTTGIYHIPVKECDIDKIVDRATMAHNYSKQLPNERKFSFYREDMREKAIRDKDIEDVMGTALKNGEFRVFFQPKYNIDSGKMEGAEALVRWFKNGKMMLPSEFIPVFEKNGFIVNVDLFVLDEVCRLQRQWLDEGINTLPISINQSNQLIYGNDYVKKLKSTVEKYNIPPRLIELELLETIIHDDIVRLTDTIRQLRDYGFLICIDDFGNGYSSLNLLKDIYADVLKVDRGFLSDAETNVRAGQVLKSIILLSKDLNMSLVVEGVETDKQLDLLKLLECHVVQGFLFDQPMEVSMYEKKLKAN